MMRRESCDGGRAVQTGLRRRLTGTAALVAAVLLVPAAALAQESVRVLPGSAIELRGRTTVGAWRCSITGAMAELSAHVPDPIGAAVVRLPLGGVDCGSRRMEADLREALRSDRHPHIVILGVHVTDRAADTVNVTATLEVAGVARTLATRVRWSLQGERMRLAGSLALRMSDFGVRPPRAALGLVRVRDEVVVQYDVLVAVPRSQELTASHLAPIARGPR